HGPGAGGRGPRGPCGVLAPTFHELFADAVPAIAPGRLAGARTAQLLGPGAGSFTLRRQPERLGLLPGRGLAPPPSGLLAASARWGFLVAVAAGWRPRAVGPGRCGPVALTTAPAGVRGLAVPPCCCRGLVPARTRPVPAGFRRPAWS